MQAEIFTLCDAATVTGGKLNLLGTFDTLAARDFPIFHPHCAVACKIRFTDEESGDYDLKIKIIDPDGTDVVPPIEDPLHLEIEEGQHRLFQQAWTLRDFRYRGVRVDRRQWLGRLATQRRKGGRESSLKDR